MSDFTRALRAILRRRFSSALAFAAVRSTSTYSCGEVARCYAGNGIVRGSEPAAELAETEIKLAALLPLLAG